MALQLLKNLGHLLCEVSEQKTFYKVKLLAPHPTPNLDPTLFDMSGLGEPARSLYSCQHSSIDHQSSQASRPAA